jgi:hypothetical protein
MIIYNDLLLWIIFESNKANHKLYFHSNSHTSGM